MFHKTALLVLTIRASATASNLVVQRVQGASNLLVDVVIDAATHPIPFTGQGVFNADGGAFQPRFLDCSPFEKIGFLCGHLSTKFCLLGTAAGCIFGCAAGKRPLRLAECDANLARTTEFICFKICPPIWCASCCPLFPVSVSAFTISISIIACSIIVPAATGARLGMYCGAECRRRLYHHIDQVQVGYATLPRDQRSASDRCVMCLENFRGDESVRVLPCRHVFHPDCIRPWLRRSEICPHSVSKTST